jgi:hypothetical protein
MNYSGPDKSSMPKTSELKSFSTADPFACFIQSSHSYANPRGNFLADCKTLINAGKFPIINSWPDLLRFMRSRSASDQAIALARKVWRQYQKQSEVRINQAVPPGRKAGGNTS